ncbi:hypothetical protein [Flexibacterium corallicola]|uniref:hypothetical protein n=1 Tax=Flexibacterium corallicola TaxID=3037259 RepID=UPI00286F0155|nr:hypothetical protein [Pseudovibrio sp. M1P-2-3]
MNITRRSITIGAISSMPLMAPSSTIAQTLLQPNLTGKDKAYIRYATHGNFAVPLNPLRYKSTLGGQYIIFCPLPDTGAATNIIVFSHSLLSDPLAYKDLLWHWASHGFTVIAPIHDDSLLSRGVTLRERSHLSVPDWKLKQLLTDQSSWYDRTRACSDILNMISEFEKVTNCEIKTDRPIIAGHGFGAFISQLIAGAKTSNMPDDTTRYYNPNFRVKLFLSPFGNGMLNLDETSWHPVEGPTLSVVPEESDNVFKTDVNSRTQLFKMASNSYHHLAVLKGKSSSRYIQQLTELNSNENQMIVGTKALTAAFIRAYGAYDADSFSHMRFNFFQNQSLGKIIERRR